MFESVTGPRKTFGVENWIGIEVGRLIEAGPPGVPPAPVVPSLARLWTVILGVSTRLVQGDV